MLVVYHVLGVALPVMYKYVRGIHVLGVVLPVMYKCIMGIHVLGVVLPVMYKCVRGIPCFRSSFCLSCISMLGVSMF